MAALCNHEGLNFQVSVYYGGIEIPNSPFSMSSNPNLDDLANKVRAYGPGLEPGGVLPGKPTNFTVDSSGSAKAPVDVAITNGKGQKVGKRPSITEMPDGNHNVSYVPPLVGEPYQVSASMAAK
jgi:filamin